MLYYTLYNDNEQNKSPYITQLCVPSVVFFIDNIIMNEPQVGSENTRQGQTL